MNDHKSLDGVGERHTWALGRACRNNELSPMHWKPCCRGLPLWCCAGSLGLFSRHFHVLLPYTFPLLPHAGGPNSAAQRSPKASRGRAWPRK